MVTLQTAENALKTVYLGVVSNQLNVNANPLLNKITKSSQDVWGKEIRKLAPFGINGGIGAGSEDGQLPTSASNSYVQFVLGLKNLFGTIELSDKAIRASQSNTGAFVNLLNDEMEGLIKASSYNLSRMLIGDGSGMLAKVAYTDDDLDLDSVNFIRVNSCKNLIEGLVVRVYNQGSNTLNTNEYRIVSIDRDAKKVVMDKDIVEIMAVGNYYLVIQGSLNNEITGLEAIFNSSVDTLYGLSKTTYNWLKPTIKTSVGSITDIKIQEVIDKLDEYYGSDIDYILCASDVKRAYQGHLNTYKRNVDMMELEGGRKAISFNGIPLVNDKFVADGEMYLLNSRNFTLHQLCDWQWLESEDGTILKQKAGHPVYSATLVKYADMICDKPNSQAKLTGITA